MTHALVAVLATPDGPFTLLAAEDGAVLASGWTDDAATVVARLRPADRPERVVPAPAGPDAPTARAASAVDAYYAGDLGAILDVPVRQAGSPLRARGWAQLRRIPAGRPLSYAAFAAALGVPRAVRAAASVCATNAPALFVPCHRVLRSDGSLGGFAWGLPVKRALLDREAGPQAGTLL